MSGFAKLGGSPVEIIPDFMSPECQTLLEEWAALPARQTY